MVLAIAIIVSAAASIIGSRWHRVASAFSVGWVLVRASSLRRSFDFLDWMILALSSPVHFVDGEVVGSSRRRLNRLLSSSLLHPFVGGVITRRKRNLTTSERIPFHQRILA